MVDKEVPEELASTHEVSHISYGSLGTVGKDRHISNGHQVNIRD